MLCGETLIISEKDVFRTMVNKDNNDYPESCINGGYLNRITVDGINVIYSSEKIQEGIA